MSALVIGFIIVMGFWFTWYFISHMMKDSEKNDSVANSSPRDKNFEPDAPS
jgi:predicted negative regulator of RcsB-dependent stress response